MNCATANGVLIYCINGARTREAEPILLNAGISPLYHLEGAFSAWINSGLEVEKGHRINDRQRRYP